MKYFTFRIRQRGLAYTVKAHTYTQAIEKVVRKSYGGKFNFENPVEQFNENESGVYSGVVSVGKYFTLKIQLEDVNKQGAKNDAS